VPSPVTEEPVASARYLSGDTPLKDKSPTMLERLKTWLDADPSRGDEGDKWRISIWWGIVVVALFTIVISLCNDPSNEPPAPPAASAVPAGPNVVDVIAGRSDLAVFSALIAAGGAEQNLITAEGFTILAPTDAAFATIDPAVIPATLADPGVARRALANHLLPIQATASDLVASGTTQTVAGVLITITEENGAVFINGARVLEANIQVPNGVIHIVDGVLGLQPNEPPEPGPEEPEPVVPAPDAPLESSLGELLAARPELATFLTTLQAADPDGSLTAGEAGVTVFAPVDDAFATLPAGSLDVLLAVQPGLLELLGYHIVPGRFLFTDLEEGLILQTMSGEDLPVTVSADGTVAVGGAGVLATDIEGANGVIHTIDSVLAPPDFVLPTLNEALALEPITFETGSSAISAGGLAALQDAVSFLNANPAVRIAIEGHTDSQGADESNQQLSEVRAQAVLDYLVSEGIAAGRLESAGFGETRPVATNDTAEGRTQNRRIEFRLLF